MVEPKATQPIRSMSAKETSTRPPSKVQEGRHQPSVTVSVFVCWIVPVILIAALTRFAVDTGPAFLPPASKPVTLDLDATKTSSSTPLPTTTQGPTKSPRKAPSESQAQAPTVLDKPSSYQEVRLCLCLRLLRKATPIRQPSDVRIFLLILIVPVFVFF
jgi:hypothetical protein